MDLTSVSPDFPDSTESTMMNTAEYSISTTDDRRTEMHQLSPWRESPYYSAYPYVAPRNRFPYTGFQYASTGRWDGNLVAECAADTAEGNYVRNQFLRARESALKYRGSASWEELRTKSSGAIGSVLSCDIPHARCPEEIRYQHNLDTLIAKLIAQAVAGGGYPEGHDNLLAYSTLPPLADFYLLNRSDKFIQRDVGYECRLRDTDNALVGYQHVEYKRMPQWLRTKYYLHIPEGGAIFRASRSLSVPTPPCVSYLMGALKRSSLGTPTRTALWRIVRAEFAELALHRFLTCARYGTDIQGGNPDYRLSSWNVPEDAPVGRLLPIPKELAWVWFRMGLHNLLRGTVWSSFRAKAVIMKSLSIDWEQSPGFWWFDYDTNSTYGMPLLEGVTSDGKAYSIPTYVGLDDQTKVYSKMEVADYYRREEPLSDLVGLPPLAGEGRVSPKQFYLDRGLPTVAEPPIPTFPIDGSPVHSPSPSADNLVGPLGTDEVDGIPPVVPDVIPSPNEGSMPAMPEVEDEITPVLTPGKSAGVKITFKVPPELVTPEALAKANEIPPLVAKGPGMESTMPPGAETNDEVDSFDWEALDSDDEARPTGTPPTTPLGGTQGPEPNLGSNMGQRVRSFATGLLAKLGPLASRPPTPTPTATAPAASLSGKSGFLRRFRSFGTNPVVGSSEIINVDELPDPPEEVSVVATAPGSSAAHAAKGQKKRKQSWITKVKKKTIPKAGITPVSKKVPTTPQKVVTPAKSSHPVTPAAPVIPVTPAPTQGGSAGVPYVVDSGVFPVGDIFNNPRDRYFTPRDRSLELSIPYAARRDDERNPHDEVSPADREAANHALMAVYGEYRSYSVSEIVGQIPLLCQK